MNDAEFQARIEKRLPIAAAQILAQLATCGECARGHEFDLNQIVVKISVQRIIDAKMPMTSPELADFDDERFDAMLCSAIVVAVPSTMRQLAAGLLFLATRVEAVSNTKLGLK